MSQYNITNSPDRVQVWDLGVRLFHWSLVAMVALAFLFDEPRKLHRTLGYVVIGLIAFRLVWGVIGPRHARFVDFIPGPRRLLDYLRDMLRGREDRHLGHNPAGAAMILVLLTTLSAVGATGYMMGMDAYFGQVWVENTHKLLVDILLVMVAFHVGGVIFSSWRHRENLVVSMITGQKDLDDK
ncbi:MAG: cytochrome b/b6 domain-containing protein [Rhodobacter sp.]|jgi:cytochrome b|nr:cytochrome b/b6 domain-containing protein [Rhodobacter sp.]